MHRRYLAVGSMVVCLGLTVACDDNRAESVAPEHDREKRTSATEGPGGDEKGEQRPAPKPSKKNLLKQQLAEHDDLEVVVSRVELPPNSKLPKHYHPGEEFVYVLEGRATQWVEGKSEEVVEEGEVAVVPHRAHHYAKTGDESVEAIVFRVHESGKPVRHIVDEEGNETPKEQ